MVPVLWALLLAVLTCAVVDTAPSTAPGLNLHVGKDAAKQGSDLHLEWRMEATAHIASLVIRNMYCKLEPERPCELPEKVKIGPLKEWASKDYGWERILSSLSLYELARRFWQQQDYERSLVAVEQSIALKLFPYTDVKLQMRWQQSLVTPGYLFKRPKLELADALILKANCMYELGRREKSVEYLYQALEAIHLSAAMMHSSMDLVQEVLNHLETLSQHVGITAADILQRMKTSKLQELMVRYGIECATCKDKGEYLAELIYRLALPVRLSGSGSGGRLEVMDQPFIHQAYAKQMYEQKHEFMQRFFAQLVGMVHSRFLSDMHVTCTSMDPATRQCHSHLPLWTYANADEYAHIWGMTPEMMRGTASVAQLLPSPNPNATPEADAAVAAELAASVAAQKPSCSGGQGGAACAGWAAAGGDDAANATEAAAPGWQQAATSPVPVRARQSPPPATDSAGRRVPMRQPPSITTFEEAGGYTLLDRDRVRAYAVKDMNALIDKFVSSDITGDVQSLLSTLDYLSSMPSGSGAGGSSGGVGDGSGGPSRLGDDGTVGSGGTGQADYTEKLQACITSPSQHPGACADILEQFDVLAVPPFPPPPMMWAKKLGPLAPLPFKPPVPAVNKCCPRYKRRVDERMTASAAARWAGQSGDDSSADASGTARGRGGSKGQAGLGEHEAGGGGARYGGAGVEDMRQISDRQLQEQLSRLANSNPYPRDDPMVILTLSGVTLGIALTIIVSKHRRRISRYLAGRGPLLSGFGSAQLAVGGHAAGSSTAAGGSTSQYSRTSGGDVSSHVDSGGGAAGPGGGPGLAGLSTPFSMSSHQKRAVAAALRDAMVGSDVSKLESAVQAAEAAALEPTLLSRAKQLLSQRRKREKERERTQQAAAKAKAKEVAKRAGRGVSRGGAESHPSRGSSRGPAVAESFHGSDDGRGENDTNGGSARRGTGWLSFLFGPLRSPSGRSQPTAIEAAADVAGSRDDAYETYPQAAHHPTATSSLSHPLPSTDMTPDQGVPNHELCSHAGPRGAHGVGLSEPPPPNPTSPSHTLHSSDYSDSVSSYNGWPTNGTDASARPAAATRKGSTGAHNTASDARGERSRHASSSAAPDRTASGGGASDEEGWVQQTSKPRRKPTPPAPPPPVLSTTAPSASSSYSAYLPSPAVRDASVLSAPSGPSTSTASRLASVGSSALTSTLNSISSTARQLKALSTSSTASSSGTSSHITPLTATRVSAAEFTTLMGAAINADGGGAHATAAARAGGDVSRTSSGQLPASTAAAAGGKPGATPAAGSQSNGWLGWIGIAGGGTGAASLPAPAGAAGAGAAPGKGVSGTTATHPTATASPSVPTHSGAAPTASNGKRGKGAAAPKATAPAPAKAQQSSANQQANGDDSLLTRASPVRTSKPAPAAAGGTSHKAGGGSSTPASGGKAGAHAASHAHGTHTKHGAQPTPAPAPAPAPAAAAAPTTTSSSSFIGALTSFMGYGGSSGAHAVPASDDTAYPSYAYDPLDSLLPDSLLDGPHHPSPSSRPLNPAAPSFNIAGSTSARATGSQGGVYASASHQPGSAPLSSTPSLSDPAALAALPHQPLSSHAPNPSAAAHGHTSNATSPMSPGTAYSNGGVGAPGGGLGGLGMGAASVLGNPFRGTTSLSSAPLTGLRASHLGAALASMASPAAGAAATGSNGSAGATPMRTTFAAPATGMAGAASALGDMAPNLAHRSMGAEGSMGAAAPANAGTSATSTYFGQGSTGTTSALGSFTMFAGSSVWSPSATNRDPGSDGWGAAGTAGACGAAATWGGLGLPSMPTISSRHNTSAFAPGGLDGRSTTGRTSLGSPVLALGSSRAANVLANLPPDDLDLGGLNSADAELQANPWAQDIMRNVVD